MISSIRSCIQPFVAPAFNFVAKDSTLYFNQFCIWHPQTVLFLCRYKQRTFQLPQHSPSAPDLFWPSGPWNWISCVFRIWVSFIIVDVCCCCCWLLLLLLLLLFHLGTLTLRLDISLCPNLRPPRSPQQAPRTCRLLSNSFLWTAVNNIKIKYRHWSIFFLDLQHVRTEGDQLIYTGIDAGDQPLWKIMMLKN